MRMFLPIFACLIVGATSSCAIEAEQDGMEDVGQTEQGALSSCHSIFAGYECSNHTDYLTCLDQLYARKLFACKETGNRESLAVATTPAAAESNLSRKGCSRWLGSPEKFLCTNDDAHETCMMYLRGHSISGCMYGGQPRKSAVYKPPSAIQAELPKCRPNPQLPGGWLCDQSSMVACGQYLRGGAVTSCIIEIDQPDLGANNYYTSSPANGAQWAITGYPRVTVTRYARGSGEETHGGISLEVPAPGAFPHPNCTPACGWGCDPSCKQVQFLIEDVDVFDGGFAISTPTSGSCGAGKARRDTGVNLFESEFDAAYDECQRVAWNDGRTTWGHSAVIVMKRKLSALWSYSRQTIEVSGYSCSYNDPGQIVGSYKQYNIPVFVTCREP